MATNATQTSDSSTDSTETEEQGTTSTEEQTTGETSGQEADGTESQEDSTTEAAPKPADKKDPAKQALLADLNKERKDLKATRTERDALKAEAEALRPVKETLDAVQAKYDRLEEFLQAAGGTLGKALDSRTFTKALFESDKDVETIVKDWNKANPSATSTALGSSAAAPGPAKTDVNALLRAAAK